MSKTRNPDALIRIGDAIKVLCRKTCYPGMLCPDNHCVEMWDEFEDVERVDAVPVRHGRWIYEERDRLDHETDDGRVFRTEKWWKCSECGNAKGYIGHKPSDKFCSKCGADMREDGDGNG